MWLFCRLDRPSSVFFFFLSFLSVLLFYSSSELPIAPLSLQPAVVERNYAIRADVFFDKDANLMKAMLELPGLKKGDLKITLSRCPYTCLKQLTVSGKSKPVFPDVGLAVKERRFGRFYRTMAVPSDTTVRHSPPSSPFNVSNEEARLRRLSRICKTASSPSSFLAHRSRTPTKSPLYRSRSRDSVNLNLLSNFDVLVVFLSICTPRHLHANNMTQNENPRSLLATPDISDTRTHQLLCTIPHFNF